MSLPSLEAAFKRMITATKIINLEIRFGKRICNNLNLSFGVHLRKKRRVMSKNRWKVNESTLIGFPRRGEEPSALPNLKFNHTKAVINT